MLLPTSLSHRVRNKWINIFKMVSDCHGIRAQRIEALPGWTCMERQLYLCWLEIWLFSKKTDPTPPRICKQLCFCFFMCYLLKATHTHTFIHLPPLLAIHCITTALVKSVTTRAKESKIL